MTDDAVSIWQSGLARALLGWMALGLLLILGLGPIGELFAQLPVSGAAIVIMVFPGLGLAAWGLFATARAPRRYWPVVPALMVYATILWFGGETLMLSSARGYFALRQATYEQIIADVEAGRLPPEGRAHGVTYEVSTGDYPGARFQWGTVSWGFFGVLYDEYTCNDRPLPQRPAPQPHAGALEQPTMKNSRVLNGYYRPFTDKACLTYAVG